MNSMVIGVQENHGLIRQFVRFFMVLYLRNSLSQQAKIDIILCVDYMLTTNIKRIQLVQYIYVLINIYQAIQM